MAEAECYDWCLILALVTRDAPLFTRSINLAVSKADKDPQPLIKLSTDMSSVSIPINATSDTLRGPYYLSI